MSLDDVRHRVCSPRVIHETLDGETVIVNLESGAYYSLDQCGQAAWLALSGGATLPETVAHLRASFLGDAGEILASTRRLLAEFVDEGLLEPGSPTAGAQLPTPPEPGTVFASPTLTRYTDMQDLLLLDPVHEIDAAAGWPMKAPA